MDSVAERLSHQGLAIPPVPAPAGLYVPAARARGLVFTAGQLPLVDGVLMTSGLVGAEVDIDTAFGCARQCALNALAAAATVCELDAVVRVVKLVGYVASAPGFTAQPAVINGASELLGFAYGERAAHAREAIGVSALPNGAPVEVSIVLELA